MSNKGRPPSKSELSLWDRVAKDVDPLLHSDHQIEDEKAVPSKQEDVISVQKKIDKKEIQQMPPVRHQKGQNNLDMATLKKLQKGKMVIEATLDLHSMTQDQAYAALKNFITIAYSQRKRCVLVITGKGRGSNKEEGILKSQLPVWVSQLPMNEIVLRYDIAQPKHGGDGAFYIYLKRNKN